MSLSGRNSQSRVTATRGAVVVVVQLLNIQCASGLRVQYKNPGTQK